jgi:hypothetical protein
MVYFEIKENPVENYLRTNCGKKLSIKTIKKNLDIKYKAVIFYAKNSKNIRTVAPYEVGSGKKFQHLYEFVNCTV